ncbi:tetratricopeptide repeat protein [Prochlorococcus marinus]|uniref:tetratricopeptide repeat protein n=1 Tax=Prochlorococcus marinus TaxID=1219 RepID=UPI0022B5B813|nr:tetratricopeptide repeat protein [Prochlorococcus marinus]
MESFHKKKQVKHNSTNLHTFTIPLALREVKENISINTEFPSQDSQKEIINKAFKFHSQGNILEAAKYYQCFLDKGFEDHRVFSNYGIILKSLGELSEAKILFHRAINIKPDFAEGHNNLGTLFESIGNFRQAEKSIREAIRLKPNFAEFYFQLANVLKKSEKYNEAEISIRKAIKLKSDYAEAYSNLGNILKNLDKFNEAERYFRKAIKLKPDFAEAYNNLGSLFRTLGELEKAEEVTRKAVDIKPDFSMALSNLGNTLQALGKLNEAEIFTREAIKFDPNYALAHINLASIQLLTGNYESGLKHYEFRDKLNNSLLLYAIPKVKKVDNENLQKGSKILVISEQGLGDTIQYMRYIPYLRNKGIDISFCAQEKLHRLIKSSGIDPNPLTAKQATKVSEGKWISLLSLPRHLNVNPKNPIISEPYIFSKDELNLKWKNILSQEKRPIVGINWQGNPEMEKTYQGRSFPLENFSGILDQNKITLLSLQKGFGTEQLDNCSFKNKFVECQPQIDSTWDFLDNAAIIHNCDLIITCDTSIAHLAGGMGKKVWLLLKDIPFWTWGLDGDSTFWYPSMRLFRQKERNNWSEVMVRVSKQLKEDV